MMTDKFVLVPWPEVQDYMMIPDFHKHSSLADSRNYGDSSYFVEEQWIKNIEGD